MRSAVAKAHVAGGKRIRLDVEIDDDAKEIVSMRITGDFFLLPEEAIADMEKIFAGMSIPVDTAGIERSVRGFLAGRHARLVGATPEAIAQLAKEATS